MDLSAASMALTETMLLCYATLREKEKKMKRGIWASIFVSLLAMAPAALGQEAEGLKFQGIDPSQVAMLAQQGSLLVIKYKDDGTLKEVVAGAVVDAPVDKVWELLTDFESYPKFMPQTTGMKTIKKISDTQVQTEQTIKVEIWVLKVAITYQHLQTLDPKKSIRFHYLSGDLPGTYGRYDLVELPGKNQTLLFYSLYSNLVALPWPIGPIMKSQPDFLTSVNVSTTSMVVKAVRVEAEKQNGVRP